MLYPEAEVWQGGDGAVARARASLQRPLPKRFYERVSVEAAEGGFAILLDGRKARTPARNLLALPTPAAADVLAAEWEAQRAVINAPDMHATRIANVGIDRIGLVRSDVLDEISRYAGADLVCCRADVPAGLVEMEASTWDPVLDHARDRHGARFVQSRGVSLATQVPETLARVAAAFSGVTCPVSLAALHTLTTLSGSALLALMLWDQAISPEAAFSASCVEEDWNVSLWGADAEATHRRARRAAEFQAASALIRTLRPIGQT